MKHSSLKHPWWIPYFFIAPFVMIFLVFIIYPLFSSLILSTMQTYGPKSREFIFLDNFKHLFADPLFWIAVRNTAVFAAASILIQLPMSLGLALLLNKPKLKGKSFFRLIFFSPSLVGLVFAAMIASLIFEKRTGLITIVLHNLINLNPEFPWLQEYVMPALIIMSLWMYVGFNMVYFLAALQNVNPALLEASMIDGAGPWNRFRYIIIPAIRPVASFVFLLSLIGSFQLFELPFILFGQTSGPNNQALTVVMYLYQSGFETGDLGYASAIGWLLAVSLAMFALLQYWISRKGEC